MRLKICYRPLDDYRRWLLEDHRSRTYFHTWREAMDYAIYSLKQRYNE